MPVFLVRELHLSEAYYGLMFTMNTVLIVLVEVPLNAAMARWSHRRALGAFLFGAGFGSMALAQGPLGVAATVVVWTFGEMILLPGMSAYVAELAPAAQRGMYMGLYGMAFSMAFVVGPWAGVTLLEQLGGQVVWSITFVVGLLATLMMGRVSPLRPPSRTDLYEP
jgi:MFS family permease